MRRMITQFKSVFLLIAAIGLCAAPAKAATYTAVASGNFSSTTTWQGGVAPGAMVSGDQIVIPVGISVNLDQNLSLAASSTLQVVGSLTASGKQYISLTASAISGTGIITVDSFATSFSNGFTYTGNLTTRAMANLNANFATSANITVNETLYLNGGVLNLGSSTFTLGNNTTIVVNGGTMTIGSATLNLTNTYNVRYEGSSASAGLELSGSGLTDVEINPGMNNNVTLNSDLDMKGTLTLTSGELILNSNDLSFSGNGQISATGSGTINTTTNSDIEIMTSNGPGGGLRFSAGANTVDDFTVNINAANEYVKIEGDLNVAGTLSLQKGMLDVQGNTLTLNTGAAISGGSKTSYVITGNGGRLAIDMMGGSSTTYHIGTANNYAPCIITGNSGSTQTKLSAGVNADVMAMGSTGSDVSATQPVVDATWFLEAAASGTISANLEFWWDSNMEVNAFDRTKAYISHYTNGSWDTEASAAASMTSNGMYKITRSNITSFSPFAVFDENTAVSVENIANNSIKVAIHPNPATDVLTVEYDADQPVQADIYSINGSKVQSAQLTNNKNTIDVSSLNTGMYFIRLNGEGVNATQRFIKK